jgi:predicted GIY-YIG superfamily endonuclease
MAHSFYVYILSTTPSTAAPAFQVGVTPDLPRRMAVVELAETRSKGPPRLVYFEKFRSAAEACVRERKIRAWRVPRKVALIESRNPAWLDLSPQDAAL